MDNLTIEVQRAKNGYALFARNNDLASHSFQAKTRNHVRVAEGLEDVGECAKDLVSEFMFDPQGPGDE